MYQVFCDGVLLFDDRLDSPHIHSPTLELELGKTGSFLFTVYTDHPQYDRISKLTSIVTVWRGDELLFRGRVLSDELGFYNEKRITCEGDLSFLLDSIQRPFSFSGTAGQLITQVLTAHNAQVDVQRRISPGQVADVGVLSYQAEEYQPSFETLENGLLEASGGYLRTRYEGGTCYLDYLTESSVMAAQTISFGVNLLELKRVRRGEDIVTALVPIGKDGLTVESVNGGSDTITDPDAVAQYGYIVKAANFSDITSASELLVRGRAYLGGLVNLPEIIELSAADLAAVGESVSSFRVGTMVRVTSPPHGIDQRFLVSKLALDLLDPAANKLTLGGVLQSFTSLPPFQPAHDGRDGEDGEDATVLRIDSSRGTVFKNSAISTTLTVAVYHGELRITTKAALVEAFGPGAHLAWSWQRMDEAVYHTISSDDARLRDDGFALVLTPADIDTKATFMCQMIL